MSNLGKWNPHHARNNTPTKEHVSPGDTEKTRIYRSTEQPLTYEGQNGPLRSPGEKGDVNEVTKEGNTRIREKGTGI